MRRTPAPAAAGIACSCTSRCELPFPALGQEPSRQNGGLVAAPVLDRGNQLMRCRVGELVERRCHVNEGSSAVGAIRLSAQA
jgi:hypothetical protein